MTVNLKHLIVGASLVVALVIGLSIYKRCNTDLPDHRDAIDDQRREHRDAVDGFHQREDALEQRRDREDRETQGLEEQRRADEEALRRHLDALRELGVEVSP